jgi:hypothetical protein
VPRTRPRYLVSLTFLSPSSVVGTCLVAENVVKEVLPFGTGEHSIVGLQWYGCQVVYSLVAERPEVIREMME